MEMENCRRGQGWGLGTANDVFSVIILQLSIILTLYVTTLGHCQSMELLKDYNELIYLFFDRQMMFL